MGPLLFSIQANPNALRRTHCFEEHFPRHDPDDKVITR
jgi:hypothetical protein